MPVHTGALIGTIKDSSSVPRGGLMAPQPRQGVEQRGAELLFVSASFNFNAQQL